MLLIANPNVPINIDRETLVYESVITAWTTALASVEKLVGGEPQAVNNGACLLAFCSWHLYPDVLITSRTSSEHHFNDPLVSAGGTLTLGLAPPGEGDTRAAFWSLSLAHLNFYGRPIRREAELDIQYEAMTFDQFVFVVFGALLWQWGFQHQQVEQPARFFQSLRSAITRTNSNSNDPKDPSNGLSILCKVSAQYLDALCDRKDPIHKLIALGSKKATKFAPDSTTRPTFTTLESPTIQIKTLKGPNERISFLRRIDPSAIIPRETYHIRFCVKQDDLGRRFDWDPQRDCGIATAFDEEDHNDSLSGAAVLRNYRWIPETWQRMDLTGGEPHQWMGVETSRNLAANEKSFTSFGDFYPRASEHDRRRDIRQYVFVYGHPSSAALFVDVPYLPGAHQFRLNPGPQEFSRISWTSKPRDATVEDFIWGLDRDIFATIMLVAPLDVRINLMYPKPSFFSA